MSRSAFSLANLVLLFTFTIALLGVIGFVYWPACGALQREREVAHAAALELKRQADESVGKDFELRLTAVRNELRTEIERFRADLARRSGSLDEWFSGVKMNAAQRMPYADDFRRAYAFAQDELRRELTAAITQAKGTVPATLPLFQPAFIIERRDPRGLDEMLPAQRAFHLERLVLLAIAQHGASPRSAMGVKPRQAAVEGAQDGYELELALAVDSARVPALLQRLRQSGAVDPIIAISDFALRPAAEPTEQSADSGPLVHLDLRLLVRPVRIEERRR